MSKVKSIKNTNISITSVIFLTLSISIFFHIDFQENNTVPSLSLATKQQVYSIARSIPFDKHADVHFKNGALQEKKLFNKIQNNISDSFKKHRIERRWMTLRLTNQTKSIFKLRKIIVPNLHKNRKSIADYAVLKEENKIFNRNQLAKHSIYIHEEQGYWLLAPIQDEIGFNYSWLAVEIGTATLGISSQKVWFFISLIIMIFSFFFLISFILDRVVLILFWDKFF